MRLAEMVRGKIVDGILSGVYRPGGRLPTEREMAELTRTSRVTVRRAYEQLERSGIISRRPSAGTCVSANFQGSGEGEGQIAVLASLEDRFVLDFIACVNKACDEADILNILAVTEGDGAAQAEKAVSLAAKGVRDMIVWGLDRSCDLSIYERLRVLGVNLVFFDRVEPGPAADYVGLDNQDAAARILEAAKAAGVAEAVYVDFAKLDADGNRRRRDCLLSAFSKAGIQSRVELAEYPPRQERLKGLASSLSKSSTPGTAIVCVNDDLALALKPSLPGSFKFFSFDGSPEARAAGVASLEQPVREMARACVERLAEQRRLGGRWRASKRLFKGRLILP